jgi:porin
MEQMKRRTVRRAIVLLFCLLGARGRPAPAQGQQGASPETPTKTRARPKAGEPEPRPLHNFFDLNYSKMTGDWGGARTYLEDHGISISLAYQQQVFFNAHGGKDTEQGFREAGSYDLILKADTKKLGLWDGGYGYVKIKGNWRDSTGLNGGKVGALSSPNADEDEDDTIFVSKWWIGQKFLNDVFDLRVGRLESKKDLFDLNEYAKNEDYQFLNNWLRSNPTVPHTTAGGVRLKIQPTDWYYFQMGAFDGDSRGSKRGALRTTFHDSGTFIGMWEAVLMPKFNSAHGALPGNYRLGLWYDGRDRTLFIDDLDGIRQPRFKSNTVGFYLSFDQMLYKENDRPKDTQGLGAFFRFGHAKEEVSRIEDFWSIGAQYQGLIPTREDDVLAFGVAQSIRSGRYRQEIDARADRETVYELYYKIAVTPWLAITPDFQFLRNAGALGTHKDVFVAGIRFRLIF